MHDALFDAAFSMEYSDKNLWKSLKPFMCYGQLCNFGLGSLIKPF